MKFKVALYPSDEGVAVCAPALPGCWSQGATVEEALASIAEAIREYLEAEVEPAEIAGHPGDPSGPGPHQSSREACYHV